MTERDNVLKARQSAAGGRAIGITAELGDDHNLMTAAAAAAGAARQCCELSSRSTRASINTYKSIDSFQPTTKATLNYARLQKRTLIGRFLAFIRYGKHVRRDCGLKLLVIIVIELVLASASTGNAQVEFDEARSIGVGARAKRTEASVWRQQDVSKQSRKELPAELCGLDHRGCGPNDRIDGDQTEAETIGGPERSNYLDVSARHNGHENNYKPSGDGSSSSSNNNNNNYHYHNEDDDKREAPVCSDCLAIPLVALVDGRQINGFIVRPAPAKLHAPVPYGLGPIGQVDGASAIRGGSALQSGDNNNYNNNGHVRMGSSEYHQGQSASLEPVANTHDNHSNSPPYQTLKQDHHYQRQLYATKPFEPKSDEHCPMEGSMTVCDEIGEYPAEAIVDRVQSLERALYKMYFNIDSLFSDERDNLIDPFESMAMMEAPPDSNMTRSTSMKADSAQEFVADLNSKYSSDMRNLFYRTNSKSAASQSEVPPTQTLLSRAVKSGENLNFPPKGEFPDQSSMSRSNSEPVRADEGSGSGTHSANRLAHRPDLDGQVNGITTYGLDLRRTKQSRGVNHACDHHGPSVSEGGAREKEKEEISAGGCAALAASGHGSGQLSPLASSFEDGSGGYEARRATTNLRQSREPKQRQQWRHQLAIRAHSNERIGPLLAPPELAAPAVASARLSSDITTKGNPLARNFASVSDDHGYDVLDGTTFPGPNSALTSEAARRHPVENNQSAANDNSPARRAGGQPIARSLADAATISASHNRRRPTSSLCCPPVSSRADDENLASEVLVARAPSKPVTSGAQRQNLLSPTTLVSALSSRQEAKRRIEPEVSKALPPLDVLPSETRQWQQSPSMQFVTVNSLRAARDDASNNRLGSQTKIQTSLRAHDEFRAQASTKGLERHRRQVSNTASDTAAVNNDNAERASNTNSDLSDLPPPSDESPDQGAVAQPICRARSIYISPRAAMNDKKQWKYVVNAPERDPRIRQIIRVDICDKQKYAKKKLLALDTQSGLLEVDSFFIPSCCICQLVPDAS